MKAITRTSLVVLLLTMAAHLVGCADQPANDGGVVTMAIGKNTYTLEVAASDASRTKGLMDRDTLPANRGMVFIFGDEQKRSFWMHNVQFPLDVIFLDSSGRIVSIRHMEAMNDTPVSSINPARYAIELNKGAAADAGVRVGDRLQLPAGILRPAR